MTRESAEPKNEATTATLGALVDRFEDAAVLCLGDVMLDHFVYGSASRISPEAPIPVLRIERKAVMLGGAGNTVRNIASLGARAGFVSVVGQDEAGNRIVHLAGKELGVEPFILTDPKRISTEKSRFIASSQQLLRADTESADPLPSQLEDRAIGYVRDEAEGFSAIVLSDYGKGMLTDRVIGEVIAIGKARGVPVIVDPKRRDLSIYRDAWMLTPNLRELSETVGRPLPGVADIAAAAREQMALHNIAHMVVTRGAQGMLLVSGAEGDTPPLVISTRAREVYDVSGAGDTVIATLAVSIACGIGLPEAVQLANVAAGIVVGKIGTSVVTRGDLKAALHLQGMSSSRPKILPQSIGAEQVAEWKREGLTVGFTNGCFDIIHAGHLGLINDCRAVCDRLVVAINSDASVRRLKGESRPVNTEMERALLLAELSAVDMVVIFGEDTPEELLHLLKPSMLMKGADYELSGIVGADYVTGYGGEVRRIPLRDGYSSTNIIERIKAKSA